MARKDILNLSEVEREQMLEAETRMYAEYFGGSAEDRRPTQLAILAAILLHLLILYVTFPNLSSTAPTLDPEKIVYVQSWRPPPPKEKEPPKPITEKKLKTKKIPIPDPTPEEPEPIKEPEPEPEPEPLPVDAIALIGIPTAPPVGNTGPLIAGVAGVSNPELLVKIDPTYPKLAREAGIQGKVFVQAVIRKDGSVGDVSIISSTAPNVGFEQAAIEAVRQWKYVPGKQNSKPVDVYFNIQVIFTIS